MKINFKSAIAIGLSGYVFGAGCDIFSSGDYYKSSIVFIVSGLLMFVGHKINPPYIK